MSNRKSDNSRRMSNVFLLDGHGAAEAQSLSSVDHAVADGQRSLLDAIGVTSAA